MQSEPPVVNLLKRTFDPFLKTAVLACTTGTTLEVSNFYPIICRPDETNSLADDVGDIPDLQIIRLRRLRSSCSGIYSVRKLGCKYWS